MASNSATLALHKAIYRPLRTYFRTLDAAVSEKYGEFPLFHIDLASWEHFKEVYKMYQVSTAPEPEEDIDMKEASDSSDDEEETQIKTEPIQPKEEETIIPRTKNEVNPEDVPLESVPVSVEETAHLMNIGHVRSVVSDNVIVQSAKGAIPMDFGSLLCLADSNTEDLVAAASNSNLLASDVKAIVLGKVDEIFGPVAAPLYVVRMDSQRAEQLREQLAAQQKDEAICTVYAVKSMTSYVAMAKVNTKGSDASNIYDEEPTDELGDFSDDEAEAEAKRARRRKKSGKKPIDSKSSGNGSRRQRPTGGRGGRGGRGGGNRNGGRGGGQHQAIQQRRTVSIPSLMSTGSSSSSSSNQQYQRGAPQMGFGQQQPRYQQQQQQQHVFYPQQQQQLQQQQQFGYNATPFGYQPQQNYQQQIQYQQQQQPRAPVLQMPMGPVPTINQINSGFNSLQAPSHAPPTIVDKRFQGM